MGLKDAISNLNTKLTAPAYGRKPEDHTRNTLENIPKNYGRGTGLSQWFPKWLKSKGAGRYPVEYNPYVHGIYYPWRYYGKADTAFSEVKLGDLPAWLSRRDKSLRGTWDLMSRGVWRYVGKYWRARKPGTVPFYSIVFFGQLYFIIMQWGKHRNAAHSKYH